jgi:HAD superfamily hydrolase (TIGR01509 family)
MTGWLILDVDDTLVNTYRTGYAKCREAARLLGVHPPTEAAFAAVYGSASFAECVRQLHPGVPLAQYQAAYDAQAEQFPAEPLCDGRTLLADAAEAGMHCGVLTNGPAGKTRRKLSACGIDESELAFVIDGDSPGERKPAVAAFTALSRFGVAPENAWFVSDSAAEWQAAEAAGFRAVGLQTGRPISHGHVPALLLTDPALLPRAVPGLAAVPAGAPPSRPLEAVTFDAGFTLIDHVREPAQIIFEQLAGARSSPAITQIRAELTAAAGTLADPATWWRAPDTARETLLGFYVQVLAALGQSNRSTAADVLAAYTDAGNWRARPGAHEAITAARSAGLAVGILANWQPTLVDILAATGLDRQVDAVVASAAIGAAKPAPEAFRYAAGAVGVPTDRLLHVGDQPIDDMFGALRAGCRAAWIPGPLDRLATLYSNGPSAAASRSTTLGS